VEADEARAADRPQAAEGAAALLEEDDVLVAARPEWLHEPPGLSELLCERVGTAG